MRTTAPTSELYETCRLMTRDAHMDVLDAIDRGDPEGEAEARDQYQSARTAQNIALRQWNREIDELLAYGRELLGIPTPTP